MVLKSESQLQQGIRQFYDASSSLWEQVWGEHMHHGYYEKGQVTKNRRQAQIDLVDELLSWSAISQATRILDVGCGIGGSSLLLAQRFQAQVDGITLSPVQAARATQRAQEQELSHQTHFRVADAQDTPFADDTFDLIWSLESGEHMPDKSAFLKECYRILQPGGRLILATWCHRPDPLSKQDEQLLHQLYQVYYLPYILSLPDYARLSTEVGFSSIRTEDWSEQVAPFWRLVIESAQDWGVALQLLTRGWPTLRAALSMGLMANGYRSGLIRYGILTAQKPRG